MKHCRILQPLSLQLRSERKEFIPGAKAGDILVTKDIDEALPPPDAPTQIKYLVDQITLENVTPSELYIEWQPRYKGGGLAKDHGGDRSCLENCHPVPGRNAQWTTPDGNEIVGYVVYTGTNSFQIQLTGTAFERLVMDSGELEIGETYRVGTVKYNHRGIDWYGFEVIE
jgi:hypothetical protein